MCRNGPGKFDVGDETFGHWFDPLALMHRFKVNKGQVTYQSKFLESDSYKKTMEEGRIVFSGFGTQIAPDPCQHMFQNFVSFFKVTIILTRDSHVVIVFYEASKPTSRGQLQCQHLAHGRQVLRHYRDFLDA